jgi:hypothetical protein
MNQSDSSGKIPVIGVVSSGDASATAEGHLSSLSIVETRKSHFKEALCCWLRPLESGGTR